MRDFLAATRERVVVFDGGMGATLEQYDLDLERDYRLPGRCHEALVLNRPDVIQGLHESMIDAGAEVVETDTFQGSRLKLDEWGLGEHTYEINRNLVLTDGARADSVPNLEIETGEVVGAGHASATGRFDDEQLFYLQARGIPEEVARRLVVRGFLSSIVQKIGVPELEVRLQDAIEAELAGETR